MKALTLHRPYPWAILRGRGPGARKDVENRGFRPSAGVLEERLAVHAGQQYSAAAAGAIDGILGLESAPCGGEPEITNTPGAIVGTVLVEGWAMVGAGGRLIEHAGVSLEEARRRVKSPWRVPRIDGRPAILWLLADPRPLSVAVVCSGQQWVWTVPDELAELVRRYEVPGG